MNFGGKKVGTRDAESRIQEVFFLPYIYFHFEKSGPWIQYWCHNNEWNIFSPLSQQDSSRKKTSVLSAIKKTCSPACWSIFGDFFKSIIMASAGGLSRLPPGEWATCPYNPCHVVQKHRLQKHLTNCRKVRKMFSIFFHSDFF